MVDGDGFFEQASDGKPRSLLAQGVEAMIAAIHSLRAEGPAWDVPISEISAADWDLTPRRRRQTELDRSIPALEKLAEVQALGDLVDIALGVQIPTKRRLRDPGAVDDAIALLGVKSIGRGGQKAFDWVARPELSEKELRKRLRGGDVLLSRAGTIGKSAVVGTERVGALPGSNLYVLRARSDSVDPHYLQAFLSSAVAKAWMMEQAQGAVIRPCPPPTCAACRCRCPPSRSNHASPTASANTARMPSSISGAPCRWTRTTPSRRRCAAGWTSPCRTWRPATHRRIGGWHSLTLSTGPASWPR